jgi:alpha-L-rhamnosidase
MEEMARALGKPDAERHYLRIFERVKAAFQEAFLKPDGSLTVETQTAYLLALNFNLLPPQVRAQATEHLVETIRQRDWHLSTGFVGIKELNPCLTLNGRSDVAYTLLLQEGYPGWLYPVRHGATTIWERWNGWTREEGFFDPLMNSFNHYSLGSVGEWLFRHVAGIDYDKDVPGFQHFHLCPYPDRRLPWASARYESHHGTIRSRWEWAGDELDWDITIPPNCTARVAVPAAAGTPVIIDNQHLEGESTGDRLCVRLGSGSYKVHSRPVTG